MPKVEPLNAEQLCRRCDPEQFSFATTEDLEELTEMIGQTRALNAVQFGTGIRREGYNLFVLGPAGTGKHTLVRQFLEQKSASEARPSDWCYVNNFSDPRKPRAMPMPAGRAAALRRDMDQLVEELRTTIPAAFESEEYRMGTREIEDQLKERQEQAFGELQKQAEEHQITLLRTPGGFAFAPTRDGEVIGPEKFEKLSEKEQKRIEAVVTALQEKLQLIIHQIPQWQKEARARVKDLNREMTMLTVGHLIDALKKSYTDLPDVLAYLDAVQQDVMDNADDFRTQEEGGATRVLGLTLHEPPSFRRYQVNVLVDNAATEGAPVIYEDNPSHQNLVGAVEHLAQLGALVTDFTLIKAGALHKANGGYLVLDVRKVLMSPYAWEGLKRALRAREVRIESLGQALSLISTVSVEPQTIPLNVKVALIGDRLLYYLLAEYDPEFNELFKVAADFEDSIDRDGANSLLYARLIATLARTEGLRPFDRAAVARLVEHSARLVEDGEKLSAHMGSVADLLRESDYWAGAGGRAVVSAADVQQTIDSQIARADRLRGRLYEQIQRNVLLIDTEGERAAQVNGLAVVALGNFSFAYPARITATARLGEGDVIDIEREVELGGAIHSKGVLILSSFLAARYAKNQPLSLAASIVFEQSYGMVEGDSASVGELCVLLSALAEAPIRQSLAVTGSVNQHGQVQAIGGVNEKVEGFFDVCRARGLTGRQGVLVPVANVAHLMLRSDVVQAANDGQFAVYPVATVDQAIELLTGIPAGEPDQDGNYPPETINGRVAARLAELLAIRKELAEAMKGKKDE